MMNYNYSPTTYPAHGVDAAATALVIGMAFFFMLVLALASYAITAFLLGRVFKKAGVPQWVAWVPVYNAWKFLELGEQYGFWAILAFIPILGLVSAVFMAIAAYNIGKKFGKEDWFVLVAVFLPVVWLIWLGFDDSKWPKAKAETKPKLKTAKKSTAKKR